MSFKCRFLLLAGLFVSGGCAMESCDNPLVPSSSSSSGSDGSYSGPELRIHPNVGSPDYKKMFTDSGEWAEARRKISVFQFYHCNVGSFPCQTQYTPDGDTNSYDDFVGVDAFKKLSGWGIPISLEMAALKHFNCENPERDMDGTTQSAIQAIDNVKSAGGRVIDVSMDEPFLGGMFRADWDGKNISGCEYTAERVAQITIDYWVNPLRQAHPDVQVGLTEAYPSFDVDALIRNIDAIESTGYHLPFLHLDVDHSAYVGGGQNFYKDVPKLQQALRSRGIKFGIVVWGSRGTSTEAWYNDAYAMAIEWRNSLNISPDRIIVQSWSRAGDKFVDSSGVTVDPSYYPLNLPETSPWTMTHLINQMPLLFR